MMKKTIREQISKIKDTDTLHEMREFIDNEMATREKVINLCEEANSIREVKNFAFIKESMEKISRSLFNTKAGRSMIDRYISEVRNNRTLVSLHSLLEGLRKLDNAASVKDMLDEWKKVGHFSNREYSDGVDSLGKILSEAYILSGTGFKEVMNEEAIRYNDAVMSAVKNKVSKNMDLSEYFNNVNYIVENFERRKDMSMEAMNEEISRFDEELKNKLESKVVSESREEDYNKEKELCLKSLDEAKERLTREGDFEACGKIELFVEGIRKKKFSEETVEEDITNFKELAECFN